MSHLAWRHVGVGVLVCCSCRSSRVLRLPHDVWRAQGGRMLKERYLRVRHEPLVCRGTGLGPVAV
eukprot:56671-Eustigmatos_ZCMA.PRE.1